MITKLGYDELKRLHEERVTRSLHRLALTKAAAEASASAKAHPSITIEPCMIIELPERPEPAHKLGA